MFIQFIADDDEDQWAKYTWEESLTFIQHQRRIKKTDARDLK